MLLVVIDPTILLHPDRIQNPDVCTHLHVLKTFLKGMPILPSLSYSAHTLAVFLDQHVYGHAGYSLLISRRPVGIPNL